MIDYITRRFEKSEEERIKIEQIKNKLIKGIIEGDLDIHKLKPAQEVLIGFDDEFHIVHFISLEDCQQSRKATFLARYGSLAESIYYYEGLEI